MSANKAELLGSTTERKIIEHDKALKGLKVRQYISSDSLDLKATQRYLVHLQNGLGSFTIAAGETIYGSFGGAVPADGKLGIPFPMFNFYVDVPDDPDYYWLNGAQIAGSGRRKLIYGWKYSSINFNGQDTDEPGRIQIDWWIKNEDTSSHEYWIELYWMTTFVIDHFS
jgi:hypothetical protein